MHEKLTGRLLTLDPTLGPTVPAFLALLEVAVEEVSWLARDPPQRRQRALEALKHVLLRESQRKPLLLVFENLHRIDAETQAFLDGMVESLPAARLLLLVNYRPEYQHSWGQKTYYTQLRLDPLPPASAEALLESLLGREAGLASPKARLIELAQGNPFFLEESVRTLVETGMLAGEPGAYRLAKALASIRVPAMVQAVLAARIDRLPPEEKQLLQTAAVIGTEVPLALLEAIAGDRVAEQAERLAHHALHLLGEIAPRREVPERDQAGDCYHQALALAEGLGMRPLQAHCHLGLGTLYAKLGQVEPARMEVSAVIDLDRAMDMTFWLPQAEAALAQVEGQ
jgi:predicted ATPase